MRAQWIGGGLIHPDSMDVRIFSRLYCRSIRLVLSLDQRANLERLEFLIRLNATYGEFILDKMTVRILRIDYSHEETAET